MDIIRGERRESGRERRRERREEREGGKELVPVNVAMGKLLNGQAALRNIK
jgi:hypothetical protein